MAEEYGTFKELNRKTLKLIIKKNSSRRTENNWMNLADFSPRRYDDNETIPIPTRKLQLNPFVVKSVLESNCKLSCKNAIRENFNLKPDPRME